MFHGSSVGIDKKSCLACGYLSLDAAHRTLPLILASQRLAIWPSTMYERCPHGHSSCGTRCLLSA
ncbi:hypothetical protein CY34DRAFT_611789 [Suillus luteus UH-Slu-Lm8-n1]|uniref:Uncharacterized protein n=1 Tax=Suillus luteus UH-Slu-Lm8-n1 TaxID=930992 RepID=A0A0D0BN25_9AGAM|nr:hypothetical protein CY34DRAFT_611789 [Suillus luteus UH-Slu-Lm8-n1]